MSIAEYFIRYKVISWMVIILTIGGGLYAYQNLGRLEDPEFTIKEAVIYTRYPGATPLEVEQEVTDPIEIAVQQLPQLKRVTSISQAGLSEITVEIKDKYDKHTLPQVWDELRRKVHDMQNQLPPGASTPLVNDDFGDVYGMLFAITGDGKSGFSYKDIKDYTDFIQREVLLVPGVAKIQIAGAQEEAIFVEISHTKLAQFGIALTDIYKLLASQNLVVDAGNVRVGDEYIRIQPSGVFNSAQAIGNLLLYSPRTKRLIHLDDLAKISRGYREVPTELAFYNGKPALMLGISIVPGGNIVKIGDAVDQKLKTLASRIPAGIQLHRVYEQPKIVEKSVSGFVINVIEALAIVLAVLLLSMGLRSGIIVAIILLLTVFGTLALMWIYAINLQRISLGALIIALGMMVDNAIVVVEGILVKIQQGVDRLTASRDVVGSTLWPLLGATIVGILAFAAIGLSQDKTGEYTRSLFQVILISLLLSWFFAITIAPMLCCMLLKSSKTTQSDSELYQSGVYRGYQAILKGCLNIRYLFVMIMVGLLALSIYGFGFIKPGFFPDSTTPLFFIDYWRPQGTDIRAVERDMQAIEKHIRKLKGVNAVSSVLGRGAIRFSLVYAPEKVNSSYGQFIIQVKDYQDIDPIADQIIHYLNQNYPDTDPKVVKIRLGTGSGAKIEARFIGPNPSVLRQLAYKAQQIMHKNPNAIEIRDDWRQPVKIIEPLYSETQARATGITRTALSDALLTAFTGKSVGIYREDNKLIPIISRPPDKERLNVANIDDVQIWSPLLKQSIPIGQVVSGFKTRWADDIIRRRNRRKTITVSCNPKSGPGGVLFKALRPKIEAIKLPPGYELEWGGEYESSRDAQAGLSANLPMGFLMMIIIVVFLFRKGRQPLIIWLCVPLSLIGVTIGLLVTHKAFEFMALLGFLSLTGMLIKNAVVLIDQMDNEIAAGKSVYEAIIHSSLSRARPVILAALTTVLGMIPLLFDAFFSSMAVTIMFGLSFATILTLVVVPVLYAIFFKAKPVNHFVNDRY